jgi:hypothetical protein
MNPQKKIPNHPVAGRRASSDRGLVTLAIVAGALCVGGAAVFVYQTLSGDPVGPGEALQQSSPAPAGIENSKPEDAGVEAVAIAEISKPPVGALPASSLPASPSHPATPRPGPSSGTRQLVNNLSMLVTTGPMNEEKAAWWKQSLQTLIKQGPAAIPALREFLEGKADVDFNANSSAALLGAPSLRIALLNALQTIGGPEAIEVSAQTLQNTIEPREIALLAGYLDQQVPEQYRLSAVNAARAALAGAGDGRLTGRDLGPVFEVMTQYGGTNVISDLQNATGKWRYYATIALGSLPDGAGVSALMQMVQDPGTGTAGSRGVALEMLAQHVADSSDVRNLLLEQARQNQLPGTTWLNVASALAGDRYGIGDPAAEGIEPVSGEKRWHLAAGGQAFFSRPADGNWTAEEVSLRVAMIDQLLAQDLGPAANEALQRARASVQRRLAQ